VYADSRSADELAREKIRPNVFLFDPMKLYETVERSKLARVFNTLKRHGITVDKMKDRTVRIDLSSRLKVALDEYFNPSLRRQDVAVESYLSDQITDANLSETTCELTEFNENNKRKNARAFISAHGKNYSPRIIARIFQGISTPSYPAEVWGLNKRWWRIHLDVDFIKPSPACGGAAWFAPAELWPLWLNWRCCLARSCPLVGLRCS